MVLDVPTKANQVPDLKQRDVRETPASTATATAVGLTGESYLLFGAGSADLTAERTLTAGEGIDLTDGGVGTTLTISGEDATDGGNKGIASFHPDDFDVTAGAVTIDDSGIDHDATTNFVADEHIASADLVLMAQVFG